MLTYFKISVITLLVFFNTICVAKFESEFDERIVRGYETKDDKLAKYVVSLRRKIWGAEFGTNHYCGGSILSPKTVLTAGHCLMLNATKIMKESELEIYAGDPVRTIRHSYVQVAYAKKFYVHSKYDARYYTADIGIILLENALKEDGQRVQSVQVVDKPPQKGWKCIICGWGVLYNDRPGTLDNGPMADKIKYANVTITEILTYQIATVGEHATKELVLRRGTCFGDAGGPLLCNGEILTGINTHQMGFCGFESRFTNAFYYSKWIMGGYKTDFLKDSHAEPKWGNAFLWLILMQLAFKTCFV